MKQTESDLSQRALDLIGEAYEQAADILKLDLERINRVRPPSLRYHSVEEVYREFLNNAGAISTFAVNLGLITPDQARQIILDFQAAHPELPGDNEGV